MDKIRVLVVDDSAVVRHLVTDVIGGDPTLDVVGTAANGQIAVDMVKRLNPDVITLDVEMPVMDGLATLAALRELPTMPAVIMFSTLTARGASATLEALSLGAADYVTKPEGVSGIAEAKDIVRAQLLPKIRALAIRRGLAVTPQIASVVSTTANDAEPQQRFERAPLRPNVGGAAVTPRAPRERIDIIAIGVSTGGPNALALLIPQIPANIGVPIVVVQHMPPLFTKLLAERLDVKSSVHVVEATDGLALEAGMVAIAPGNFHMEVHGSATSPRIKLNQEPPENSCRPAVDVLFRSVARIYESHVLALVLTGMGHDGADGCHDFKMRGSYVAVQDEASSIVWGMPGAVVANNEADAILPLAEIADFLIRCAGNNRTGASARLRSEGA